MPDVLFILMLALVVLGPKKLPEIAAQMGKYLAQFQRMKRELMDHVSVEMLHLEQEAGLKKEPNGGNQTS
jgi:sec-independent protein translocase protein TatB